MKRLIQPLLLCLLIVGCVKYDEPTFAPGEIPVIPPFVSPCTDEITDSQIDFYQVFFNGGMLDTVYFDSESISNISTLDNTVTFSTESGEYTISFPGNALPSSNAEFVINHPGNFEDGQVLIFYESTEVGDNDYYGNSSSLFFNKGSGDSFTIEMCHVGMGFWTPFVSGTSYYVSLRISSP